MRYIGEEDVRGVLGYAALIPAVRQGLVDYSAGRVQQPLRTILRVGEESGGEAGGWFAVMPVTAGGVMAVKTVTFFPGNAALGKPTHLAMIELLDGTTGEPLAVMDGRLITEMRTAAVSAVALEALGRRGARVFAEIGEILLGKVAVPDGRVVFKSVGMAVEDLVAAGLVWVLAARANAPSAP